MKVKLLLAIAALLLMVQPVARAAPTDPIVYTGSLAYQGTVTGTTGAFSWFGMNDVPPLDGDLPAVQFWSFVLPATLNNKEVNITGHRLNNNLDPAFSLYSGLITPGTTLGAFDPFNSFDGLTFLANADDELAAPGPFGDPQFIGRLPAGTYTIAIGGVASDCPGGTCPAGGYPYSLTLLVPEPSTVPLMLVALIGVGMAIRRQGILKPTRLA